MLGREEMSIWSILKQSIGKELTKITMPVVFNEPLSFLQRLSEYMEYTELVLRASMESEAVKRMELVSAFAVSALAANWDRVAKPFNPLLGETYEMDRLDSLGFRMVAEQVSHHPPVSAFHAESPAHFRFHGSIYPKLKFWGPSVEIQPRGVLTLNLLKHKETYTWTNVNCSVHNLVMGKMYIEQTGVMEISCQETGLKAILNFKPSSNWFGGSHSTNHIQGSIMDGKKRPLRGLYGNWTEFLASVSPAAMESGLGVWGRKQKELKTQASMADAPASPEAVSIPILAGSDVLWRVKPRPSDAAKFYNFTLFAMALNEVKEEELGRLAPTDCRLRPDIRAMENGDWEMAASEKHRLEEKQREARRSRPKGQDWQPRWFSLAPHSCLPKEQVWTFNDRFWERDFSHCDQLF